jgi:cold shock protein
VAQGAVKRFNADKGYRFIAPDDGAPDVFFHHSAIEADGYRSLQDNQRVGYTVTRAPRARGPSRFARFETAPCTRGHRQYGIRCSRRWAVCQ